MKFSNTTYDRIKWIALAFIPAFEVLILTVGKIWSIPYYSEIGATVAAIGVFLAAVIGVSAKTYKENLAAIASLEALQQDGDTGEGETDATI